MIIPMWVDEKKDKRLVDWLNSFTNRSATMRMCLYNAMNGIVVEKKLEEQDLDNTFMDSLDMFNEAN